MKVRVGFVGLGVMGAPMARNLLKAGFEVVAFTRSAAALDELVEEGAEAAASPADAAARSDVTITMLPNSAVVEEVVLGSAGVLEGARPGSLIVDMSTIDPAVSQRLAEAGKERGVAVLDAPVTGAADGARAGTLTVFVGADADALERCRPLLEAIGSRVVHTGPVGTGSAAKLLTNMLWFVHVVALSDALALGAKAGIPPETLAGAIRASAGGSWVAEHDLPNILRGDDDASFTLALCCKDLGLIEELAEELAVPVPLAALAAERFAAASERFGAGAGELAVARLAEVGSGVSFRLTELEEARRP